MSSMSLALTLALPADGSKLTALLLVLALAIVQLANVRMDVLATNKGLYGSGILGGIAYGLAGLGGITPPADAQTTATAISSGTFQDADQRHQGAGTATLAETESGDFVLQFTDFSVTPGPDLEVWLVADEAPATSAAVLASEWVSLGGIQAHDGAQTYEIPEDVDVSEYGSVVIWCEDFSVLFAVASFQ